MTELNLYHVPFDQLFKELRSQFERVSYDFGKHVIWLKDEKYDVLGFLRLPLHIAINEDISVQDDQVNCLYLSIESGNAAICLTKGKEVVYHTTFSAYMTRKKQGFSQVKYLNKKGKSRAGSRVRLASTVLFFENINTTLTELMQEHAVSRVALNCSTTLIPFLYQSKVSCPFEKQDARLYKIPLHIPQSNYTNLHSAIKKLRAPVLFYEESNANRMERIRLLVADRPDSE